MVKCDERERLIVENDRLAGWYVRRFVAMTPADPRHDDLIQAARLGLVEAARRYDPAKGEFSSYAVWWMGRFVGEAKRAFHAIRLRRSTRDIAAPTFVDPDELDGMGAEADASLEQRIDARRLRALLLALNDRERTVIELRWLSADPLTLREAGERLGCTREGARYLEVRAFDKLRRLLTLKLTRAARRRRMAQVERRLRRADGRRRTLSH